MVCTILIPERKHNAVPKQLLIYHLKLTSFQNQLCISQKTGVQQFKPPPCLVVNQGYSEEVMNAARAAGAGGGTVLHSRRIGDEEALSFWGISVQDQKAAS